MNRWIYKCDDQFTSDEDELFCGKEEDEMIIDEEEDREEYKGPNEED